MPKVYPGYLKIGVTRVGGAGDALVASSAIAGIRRKYPEAMIVGHTSGWGTRIWFGNPALTRVEDVVAQQPLRMNYDIWYDLKQWPSPIYLSELGAREQADTEQRKRAFLSTLPGGVENPYGNDQNCTVLQRELLDIDCSATDAFVRITPEDEQLVEQFRRVGPYVTVHDWAWGGRQTKCWFQDRWAEVVEWLKAQGLAVFQIGDGNEELIPGSISLLGQLTFQQSAALVKTARLHIDNESSMAHLTPALKTPTIVLCGPTNWMHWCHDENYNLIGDYDCTFSAGDRPFKGRCEGQFTDWYRQCGKGINRACMQSITVEMVVEQAKRIFDGSARSNSLVAANKITYGAASVLVMHPSNGKAELLDQCLRSLQQYPPQGIDHNIVVVNGMRDDAPTDAVLQRYDYPFLDATKTGLGLPELCNQAAQMVSGRYLAFVRSDVAVMPGWLEKMLGYLEGHPETAVVAPKLISQDNTILHYGVVFGSDKRPALWKFRVDANQAMFAAIREFQAVSHSLVVVRRAFFERVGGYRPDMDGLEDIDLCLRARREGSRVVCNPAAYAQKFCSDGGSFRNAMLASGPVVDRLLAEHGPFIEADSNLYDSIEGHKVLT